MNKLFTRTLIVLLFGSLAFYFSWKGYNNFYFSETDKPITLRFHYMKYACGDCFPQWNVDSILDRDEKYQKFFNKDMQVFYKEKKLDDQLGDADRNCIICSEFYITGEVGKTLSGKYKLMAEKYNYIKDTACCNN
jgi:hypothetical protein